jgi:ElaB/YqjD/DUF883 family membrane-anchored ribosome-binding protein
MTEVRERAAEQAQRAGDQAREKVRTQVDQRSTQLGEQVSRQADDARSIGEQLRNQGKDGPARLADQLADRAERMGSWLQESDGDRILRDVEDFGRRNPWAIAAGGAALGFALSRMLKASSSRRYGAQSEGESQRQLEARFQRPGLSEPMMGDVAPAPPPGTSL